jgi:hypothetical protein
MAKIAEIRQISGAMIRISKSEESSADGEAASNERQITITGSADSIALAKSLINMSLDIHKSKMEEREAGRDGGGGGGGARDHRGGGDHR